jgi:membrane fusion protein (multidrug efflux system)
MNKLSIIIILIISSSALGSCNSSTEKKEGHEHEHVKYLVTKPLVRDTSITRNYVCQIRSIQHIELRALERGYLQKIYVDEGQYVKKGQTMFQIMPMLYQAEYQKTQAEVNYVEIEYQNTKQLADRNVVSQNELALAKAKLNKAKAEMALAKVHLNFTEIKAPFSGFMDHFHVRLGSLINEGDLLTSLSDNSQMWMYFNVPEAEYLEYKQHIKRDNMLKVKLLMANNQLFEHEGEVKTIEADFDNSTGNIAFRATFPNPDLLLRHGETGNIIVTKNIKNAIIIPQKSTYEVLDQKYVFVIDKNNRVKSRRIEIASEMTDLYVIKSGLKESDQILLEGLRLVHENDVIKFDYMKPIDAISHLKIHAE